MAVALALLLSLSLVFAAASAQWVMARSAEVQSVADATALAGENVVAAYSTVAQTLDACVLSMGLAGVIVYGAGLVVSCVPGLSAAGLEMTEAGGHILESRREFAKSAASGLDALESTLPLLIVLNSAACVEANSRDGLEYVGCALPFPAQSQSDFSSLEADVDDEGLAEISEQMREASDEVAQAEEEADAAREKGWRADCVTTPYCLRERAATLAGLSDSLNPTYATADSWTFGAALVRARRYYAARYANEVVAGSSGEALTDSACRKAFYRYALAKVNAGSYVESEDGSVTIDLPSLPRNADQTKETELYTEVVWPCTDEDGVRTLHSSTLCPGATGASSGSASLSSIGSGVAKCAVCGMDVGEMGRVAAASTSISNGFEYHWSIIVEASEEYEAARNRQAAAEAKVRELAEQGADAFSQALEQLAVERPTLCPPGAWGCVSVIYRSGGVTVPTELTSSFLSAAELPAGAAVSAAVLAPDDATAENNVLSSFFDALSQDGSVVGGTVDGVMELWGSLLVGYGSLYEDVSDTGGDFLDKLDGVFGGTTGSWLKGKLKQVMQDAGFEPADMRLRKPVLTNTQDVLEKGGYDKASTVRELVLALPDSGSATDYASSLGLYLVNEIGGGSITVAEIPIPGTDVKIPLTIDLSELGEAA